MNSIQKTALCWSWSWKLLACVVFCLEVSVSFAAQLLKGDATYIRIGSQRIRPLKVTLSNEHTYVYADDRFVISPKRIRSTNSRTGKVRDVVVAKDVRMFWLGEIGATGYSVFLGPDTTDGENFIMPFVTGEIHAFDFSRGRWLLGEYKLTPPRDGSDRTKTQNTGQAEVAGGEVITAAALSKKYFAILTAQVRPSIGFVPALIDAYTITCFRHGSLTPLWSKRNRFLGNDVNGLDENVFIRGENIQAERGDGIVGVQIVNIENAGPHVVVCAGKKEDVVCYTADSGEELFRERRLWEFEKGYYASEFAPFVTRFGGSPRDGFEIAFEDEPKKDIQKDRKKPAQIVGEIRVGPIVLVDPKDGFATDMYVGTSVTRNAPRAGWHQCPRSRIYKIDLNNRDINDIYEVPRPLTRVWSVGDNNMVVWECSDTSFFIRNPGGRITFTEFGKSFTPWGCGHDAHYSVSVAPKGHLIWPTRLTVEGKQQIRLEYRVGHLNSGRYNDLEFRTNLGADQGKSSLDAVSAIRRGRQIRSVVQFHDDGRCSFILTGLPCGFTKRIEFRTSDILVLPGNANRGLKDEQ